MTDSTTRAILICMICKKCGADFAIRAVIDGRERNFQRRKYCLTCSPFGSGNTQKLETFDENRPSKKSRRHTSWIRQQRKARRERKEKLVKMLGGKCIACGYKKSMAALSFHHRDPKTKLFNLASNGFLTRWDRLLEEAKKCELLCMNCHCERHEDEREPS